MFGKVALQSGHNRLPSPGRKFHYKKQRRTKNLLLFQVGYNKILKTIVVCHTNHSKILILTTCVRISKTRKILRRSVAELK